MEFRVVVKDSFIVEADSEEEAVQQVSAGGWFDISEAQIYVEQEENEDEKDE